MVDCWYAAPHSVFFGHFNVCLFLSSFTNHHGHSFLIFMSSYLTNLRSAFFYSSLFACEVFFLEDDFFFVAVVVGYQFCAWQLFVWRRWRRWIKQTKTKFFFFARFLEEKRSCSEAYYLCWPPWNWANSKKVRINAIFKLNPLFIPSFCRGAV